MKCHKRVGELIIMAGADYMEKVSFIVETDGLLRDYITSVVIKEIKTRIDDKSFMRISSNHIHAALLLKTVSPCSLKDFAAVMRLSKSSASALVERMVEKNIVERKPNPDNRREILLSVNPDFEKHVTFVRKELADWFAGLIDELGQEAFEKWYSVMQQLNKVMLKKIKGNQP